MTKLEKFFLSGDICEWVCYGSNFDCKEEGKYATILKVFHGVFLNYPTYDKELYALFQALSRSGNTI
jgi:hypothetical protein